ncbi:YbeD family protein [Halopseudomonas sp.]|uniref:YbeD family protein n=1 Tax=Halopseudomonas sp. TaxID=2901191 RepID=UPI0035688B03
MNGKNQEAPRIDFPCQYPIKVIGNAGEGFVALVTDIVERHAPGLDSSAIDIIESKNGRFLSVRMEITATGPDQLQELNAELKATGRVQMVL